MNTFVKLFFVVKTLSTGMKYSQKTKPPMGYIIEGLGILVYSMLDILATVFPCVYTITAGSDAATSTNSMASLSLCEDSYRSW